MRANRIDSTILGPSQDSAIADYLRDLFLGVGDRIALVLKRNAAGMTPRPAMCWPIGSTRRHQRHPRWLSGVVVEPGTVGVRW